MGSGDTFSQAHSGADGDGANGEMLASLKDYTRSIGAGESASTPATGKLLPDVNTMIERLAVRLETQPKDLKGWQMLGWSYFNTGRYKDAVAAYARAVELDPQSAELKRAYEEAKSKASENSSNSETGASLRTEGKGTEGKGTEGKGTEGKGTEGKGT